MNLFQKELCDFIDHTIRVNGGNDVEVPSISTSSPQDAYHKYWSSHRGVAFEQEIRDEYQAASLGQWHFPLFIRSDLYQPLPRCVDSLGHYIDVIKPAFSCRKALMKHLYWKAFLSLYPQPVGATKEKIVLLTYVLKDGLGDFQAAEVAKVQLEGEFSSVYRISIVPIQFKNMMPPSSNSHMIHYYQVEEESSPQHFSSEIKRCLQEVSVLLQVPTCYPYWGDLLTQYEPKTHYTIGEYGFIDSTWAHPMVDNTVCMGLHDLEKGIWIKSQNDWSFSRKTQDRLFANQSIASYSAKKDCIFAYLKTSEGICSFFHLALVYYSDSLKDLDIIVPDVKAFLFLLKEDRLLLSDYQIKTLYILSSEQEYVVPIQEKGKMLRMIEVGYIPSEEALSYVRLSKGLFACRGDQSFSEAVSFNTLFFYDAAPHAGPFLEDFQGIVNGRLGAYPLAQEYFKGFNRVFLLKGQWEELAAVGRSMGRLLKKKETQRGIKYLNAILRNEYNFNTSFIHLVRSLVLHSRFPRLSVAHEHVVNACVRKEISLSQALEQLSIELGRSDRSGD